MKRSRGTNERHRIPDDIAGSEHGKKGVVLVPSEVEVLLHAAHVTVAQIESRVKGDLDGTHTH